MNYFCYRNCVIWRYFTTRIESALDRLADMVEEWESACEDLAQRRQHLLRMQADEEQQQHMEIKKLANSIEVNYGYLFEINFYPYLLLG